MYASHISQVSTYMPTKLSRAGSSIAATFHSNLCCSAKMGACFCPSQTFEPPFSQAETVFIAHAVLSTYSFK